MTKCAKRDRLNIVYDVLVCCSAKRMSVTNIARGANLNAYFVHEITMELVKLRLLCEQRVEGKSFFMVSASGRDFVKRYFDLSVMVQPLLVGLQDGRRLY